jgi:hypothetical protein
MVAVVQLVERQVVILNVAGSSPVSHPKEARGFSPSGLLLFPIRIAGGPKADACQPTLFGVRQYRLGAPSEMATQYHLGNVKTIWRWSARN